MASLTGTVFSLILLALNAALYRWYYIRGLYQNMREVGSALLIISLAALGTVIATKATMACIGQMRSSGGTRGLLRRTLSQTLVFIRKCGRSWAAIAAAIVIAAFGFIAYRHTSDSDFGKTVVRDSDGFDGTKSSDSEERSARPIESPHEPSPPPGFTEDVTQPETKRNHPPTDLKAIPVLPNPSAYNREANGARIGNDVGTTGLGKLTVENGTALDAVVRLVDTSNNATMRWFYVRSKATATVGGIEPGSYALMYTTGADWDQGADEFRKEPDYSAFERQFTYLETPDGENITKYKMISVTLHGVPSGNVRTRHISRQEFLRGHRTTGGPS